MRNTHAGSFNEQCGAIVTANTYPRRFHSSG
jgi:hypothetical protein